MKDETRSLPLFDWSPPAVQLIPFPFSARIGRARHVATRLLTKRTEKERDAYCHAVDDHTRQAMEKLGASESEIVAAQDALRNLITREHARLASTHAGAADEPA